MVHSLFVFFLFIDQVSVYDAEGPPVPIPNTEVKLCHGNNTLRVTAREDSSSPTFSEDIQVMYILLFYI